MRQALMYHVLQKTLEPKCGRTQQLPRRFAQVKNAYENHIQIWPCSQAMPMFSSQLHSITEQQIVFGFSNVPNESASQPASQHSAQTPKRCLKFDFQLSCTTKRDFGSTKQYFPSYGPNAAAEAVFH